VKTILSIDQSTSATKAFLYDLDGKPLDREARGHEQHYPRPGWVEHDAEEIWQNTLAVLRDLLKRDGARSAEIQCLSLTNQRETFVIFDRKTGRPLRPAIVWQCRRGDPICDALDRDGHDRTVRDRTGLRINTYFSAPKLAWVIQNEPEVAELLRGGRALFGTIDTYLIYRFTKTRTFATDHTNASRTLLYSIRERSWDETLCDCFGVPFETLAEIRESASRFGDTTAEGLLDSPIPICGVMGDSQASLFAHHCFDAGMAKVTIGTGSSVLLNVGTDLQIVENGTVSTVGWVYREEPTYCFEGIINYAAATLVWLRDQLQLVDDADSVEELAASVEDNGGVYLVPAFAGLSAPYWDQDARAAIVGMSAHSSRAHIVRAALESIAYQIRDALEMMQESTSHPLRTIHADGGATKNRFLMQFTADVTGREVRVAEKKDLSPLGAMQCGLLGMGIRSSLKELSELPQAGVDYSPTRDETQVDAALNGWRRAVERVLTREKKES
jgi:glycerol kinase